jgi:hypothetical protein
MYLEWNSNAFWRINYPAKCWVQRGSEVIGVQHKSHSSYEI